MRLPYGVRLRRARSNAALRHERRALRSAHIARRFREYYGKQAHSSSQLWIHDAWTGQRCRWSYEQSLHLEDQAFMLRQRLEHVRPST